MKKYVLTAAFSLGLPMVGISPAYAADRTQSDTCLSIGQKNKLNIRDMEVKDTVSYLFGFSTASKLYGNPYQFDVESFLKGVQAALEGKDCGFSNEEFQKIVSQWQQEQREKAQERSLQNKVDGKQFLVDNLAKDKDVKQTRSGLQYKVLKEGNGKSPKATDKVLVHYEGTLIDGTVFDSSIKRGEPISFPLNGVIAGWTEGLQLMKEGGEYIFYIPSELAYGDQDNGPIPGGSTLVFKVQLIEVNPK